MIIVVAVKDNAIGTFQPPACVRAEGEALRGFMDAVNDPQNKQLHQHPEDFDLYRLGTFDENTGKIVSEEPVQLARGIGVKIKG